MARFNALKSCVDRIRALRKPQPESAVASLDHHMIIANAIHHRERDGKATTLRDLHKISELSQSDALKAVSVLERAGMVVVSDNTHDAFESAVSLSPKTRDEIETNLRRNAA